MRIYVWLQTQLLLGSNFFLPDLWQPSLCTTSLGCQRLFLLYINKEIFKYFSIQNMLSKIYSNTFICHLGKYSEQTENFVFCFVWHYQKQLNRGLKIFLYDNMGCIPVYKTVCWYMPCILLKLYTGIQIPKNLQIPKKILKILKKYPKTQ